MIMYYSKFDTVNYKLPVYDKIRLKKIFNKYYNFEDENICFYIKTDSNGRVLYFKFSDSEIIEHEKFLSEIKNKVTIRPAVYLGKNVSVKNFECISCIILDE